MTTPANLIRWAGLSAVAGGILFAVMQVIHPPETLSSVTTGAWALVHYMGVVMCLLNLAGITGIYARQADRAGRLGLAGFLLLAIFWPLTAAFQLAEALIVPRLAAQAPAFVEGWLGVVTGSPTAEDLGAIPDVYLFASALYLVGGVVFGIATLRAGMLPRWAAGLLAGANVAPVILSIGAPNLLRVAVVPASAALVWLGLALWFERRGITSERVAGAASTPPGPAVPATATAARPSTRTGALAC